MLTTQPEFQFFSRLLKARRAPKESAVGFIDYYYLPVALGDAFTMMVKMSIEAHKKGASSLRLYLGVNGHEFMKHQPHINEGTYRHHIANLLPAFLCSPIPTSLHVSRRRFDSNPILFSSQLKDQAIWPSYTEHVNGTADYYSHYSINSFFKENGFIPKLVSPIGYTERANHFFEKFFRNKFFVTVNIRQRAFTDNFSQLERDSSLSAWYRFFDVIAEKYPDVIFLNMGANNEWDLPLARKPNVVISRTRGMGLGEELALLFRSNLFMGTSSGFAAAATFSSVPYVITNFENKTAYRLEIEIGDNYPFAGENQTLSWTLETTESLVDEFEQKYRNLK